MSKCVRAALVLRRVCGGRLVGTQPRHFRFCSTRRGHGSADHCVTSSMNRVIASGGMCLAPILAPHLARLARMPQREPNQTSRTDRNSQPPTPALLRNVRAAVHHPDRGDLMPPHLLLWKEVGFGGSGGKVGGSSSGRMASTAVPKPKPSPEGEDGGKKKVLMGTPPQSAPHGSPSEQQLAHVQNVLADTLPKIFTNPMDYKIYSNDIVFVNNIKKKQTVGIYAYARQVALLRVVGHLKYAYVTFEILRMTKHPEDNTVRVRWRIKGVSALKVFLNFWKFKLWDLKESIRTHETWWYDGFSTYHVGGDGVVFKHVVDKVTPSEDHLHVKKSNNPLEKLAPKLALAIALGPNALGDAMSVVLD